MHRVRRLTAVITHLLMIQLAIVSGAMACPMAHDEAGEAMSVAMRSDAHAPPSHDEPATAASAGETRGPAASHLPQRSHHHDASQCDSSCTPAGCTPGGHCGSAVALRPGAPTERPSDVGGRRMYARAGAPTSVSTAPEPPPPRA